ncbi:ionic transporter y4hA [Alloacidobacterium sp.]|uniref:calcium:proton antiporter n=1 Tax=Alloacidobacterium sp. TaxID=2951999 RepID=UPI002D726DD2|nr:ionic transporter y4hA [Alloacidobacterium sp.]HYK37897.1 ionic transporter y4hA [Alloacidobacterium sp.]
MVQAKSFVRLFIAWVSVALFLILGGKWMAALNSHRAALGLFVWLFTIIVWVAFGVVHEAEELAEMLGEPFGTLILTLSIVIIEVALISAVMLGTSGATTLARDTMFSVVMIVLNGVVGLGLLVGGIRHHEQAFNLQGASAYLAVIIPLTTIALVLPRFTTSTPDGSLTTFQSVAFSILTIVLYGLFLWLQTGRHRGYFVAPSASDAAPPQVSPAPKLRRGKLTPHVAMLLINILPIVILSKSLAKVLDHGIAASGAPPALGGIIIAMLVFTPEGVSALIAIRGDQLTRAINLCLGSVASTVGLTLPAMLAIGLYTRQTVVLGLPPASIALLVATLILSILTFTGWRTTMLEGAVHLSMFAIFLVLVFSP